MFERTGSCRHRVVAAVIIPGEFVSDRDDRVGDRVDPRMPGRRTAGAQRRPLAVHHRRRRAAALTALAGLALLAGVAVGARASNGDRAARTAAAAPDGYFTRLRILAGSLAVSEQGAENTAINRTLSYAPIVRMAGTQHREIALTFDDGPGPYTPQILRVLQRTHTAATFFEVGVLEQYFHASTSEIVADGDPIGDHTETHAPMSELPRSVQQSQLLEQTAAIGAFGAPFPRLFRPPYGLWNATTLALLRKYRMLMVLWTVDTSDWQLPGATVIVQRVLTGAKPGAIILMHDGGGDRSETVAALPQIIRGLRARGYRLVTVPKLLLDNPAPKQQDVATVAGAGD